MERRPNFPRILLVDDNEVTIKAFLGLLVDDHKFDVIATSTAEQATKAIEEMYGPVIILLDRWFKNEKGDTVFGEQLLPELVRKSLFSPLVIISSIDNHVSTERLTIDAGATWFLPKDRTDDLLIPYIWRAVHTIQAFMQLKCDPLTQAYNRQTMFDGVVRELSRASRTEESMACIMFDIDRLKPINDTYGHAAGDEIIKSVVNSIREHIRTHTDIICRYGGDEIVVFLFDIKKNDVKHFIEQTCKTIVSKKITVKKDDRPSEEICVSASVGFSMITPKNINRALARKSGTAYHAEQVQIFWKLIENSIEQADKQMYADKKTKKQQEGQLSLPIPEVLNNKRR